MAKTIPLSYYKSLPKKRMAAGVILRNSAGKILILKTTYKDHWEIPGGVVEEDESPIQTAQRETFEEIGLKVEIHSCLVVHYRSAQKGQDENIMFTFDGGFVPQNHLFKLDAKEISEIKYVSFKEGFNFLGERITSRLPFIRKALEEQRTYYLESCESLLPSVF